MGNKINNLTSIDTYSVDKILQLYEKNKFNITTTAKCLGVRRDILMNRIKNDEVLSHHLMNVSEELVDIAEDGLRYHLEKREKWAIEFVLSSKGKNRGYGKNTDGVNKSSIENTLILLPDNQRGDHLSAETIETKDLKDKIKNK